MRKKDVRVANQRMLNFTVALNYLSNDFYVNDALELLSGKDTMFEFAAGNPGLSSGLLRASVLDNYAGCQATVISNLKQLSSIGLKKNLRIN